MRYTNIYTILIIILGVQPHYINASASPKQVIEIQSEKTPWENTNFENGYGPTDNLAITRAFQFYDSLSIDQMQKYHIPNLAIVEGCSLLFFSGEIVSRALSKFISFILNDEDIDDYDFLVNNLSPISRCIQNYGYTGGSRAQTESHSETAIACAFLSGEIQQQDLYIKSYLEMCCNCQKFWSGGKTIKKVDEGAPLQFTDLNQPNTLRVTSSENEKIFGF